MAPRSSSSLLTAGLAIAGALYGTVHAQEATADGGHDSVIWHNRYHAILAMAAYGDWNTLCPQQTFTQEGLLANFPNSTEPTWTVLDRFGPTEHGAEGWTAYIPEMNKVTLIFKGDYNIEKNLPQETADLDVFGLGDACQGCRANSYALAGYMEAYHATNGFENAMKKWREVDCFFSVTGHGLGGMHSILSTVHLGSQGIVTFSHNYGAPRTLNPAAAAYHNFILGGDQLDRGIANGDVFTTFIPASGDYAHVNTGVLYHGWNDEFKMNTEFCYEAPEDARCFATGELNEADHYFYFSNVGQCGGAARQDRSVGEAYIAQQQARAGEVVMASTAAREAILSSTLSLPSGTTYATQSTSTSASASVDSSSVVSSVEGSMTTMGASTAVSSSASSTGSSIASQGIAGAANSGAVKNASAAATTADTGSASKLAMGSSAALLVLSTMVVALASL